MTLIAFSRGVKNTPLSRINLILAQKINIIEKYGLPGHDHKKIAEKYDVSEKDYFGIHLISLITT